MEKNCTWNQSFRQATGSAPVGKRPEPTSRCSPYGHGSFSIPRKTRQKRQRPRSLRAAKNIGGCLRGGSRACDSTRCKQDFYRVEKNKNTNGNENQQLQEQQHLHSCCPRRAGKHGEQAGDAGGRQEGSLVRCQRWELRNAKSVPYGKEILESRQRFLPLFIDNKDMEKERGRF